MKTIEILEREHEWIGWMAESLAALVEQGRAEQALPEAAYELLSLFEVFADGRHQDKEEGVLFPELLAAADDRDRALLGQLVSDHEAERRLLSGMRLNVLGAVYGKPGCSSEFAREAGEYLKLQRAHMGRESKLLIPMAERLLTEEADARVVQGFQEIEGGAGDPHGLREQILSLHHRAGLPGPTAG